jgi:hypothetical protein
MPRKPSKYAMTPPFRVGDWVRVKPDVYLIELWANLDGVVRQCNAPTKNHGWSVEFEAYDPHHKIKFSNGMSPHGRTLVAYADSLRWEPPLNRE